ncbi:NYN domain-containing protein [Clostridium oryzae]|uniref:YacP-like NYN domain protein n=1 Tax=Clostridium oryzae TaxID=1450648 RepID=A0A1V4IKQ0_9CLOT|nr:NYN domain-containing protein [Clostridium oryzae]OPJ60612.1 YacP-like NYN domain protein [Clostridium oryzae]
MRIIFVDGYNVINSWPELNDIKKYSYEKARQKLIEMLQEYAAYKGYKLVLVFDGHKLQGNLGSKERVSGITVVFTKENETADNYIEKSVNDIGKNQDICVVTSDAMEQMVIFQRGATRMSSAEFHLEVQDARKSIKKKIEGMPSIQRNVLEERIDKDILEKLEKIRRNH